MTTDTKRKTPPASKITNRIVTEKNIVTYSWCKTTQGICGHLFEAFELFYNLNEQNKPSILLIGDEIQSKRVLMALYFKYDIEVVNKYFDLIEYNRPKLITCAGDIIITDGIVPNAIIRTNSLHLILCAKEPNTSFMNQVQVATSTWIYHDQRLEHNLEKFIPFNKKHNIKYLNFIKQFDPDLYKKPKADKINKTKERIGFIYSTPNCRNFNILDRTDPDVQHILKIIREQKLTKLRMIIDFETLDSPFFEKMDIIGKFERLKEIYQSPETELILHHSSELPIMDLFDEFTHYIYTPTKRNWDCSSRLIVECKMYKKYIYFTKSTIDNIESNQGLKYRIEDLRVKNKLFGKNKILTDNINKSGK